MRDDKAIEQAVSAIEKQFGKGAIMRLGEESTNEGIETVSSGSLSLDMALGVGGFPKGRVIEIYGPESSGKTTLTLHAVAECQKKGGVAAFVDAEHALDTVYAKKIGVNLDELLVSQPDTGEQALEIVDMLVRSLYHCHIFLLLPVLCRFFLILSNTSMFRRSPSLLEQSCLRG